MVTEIYKLLGGAILSFKKSFFIIFIIFFVLIVVNCSKQVIVDPKNSKNQNYDFIILNDNCIDKTMGTQRYVYTTTCGKIYIAAAIYKPIAIMTDHSKNAAMKQYLVDNNETLNLTISKDSKFIISLPANHTIAYTWNIKNDINNGIIQYTDRSWIHIPLPKQDWDKCGADYGRQNFFFKPLKSGNEKVVMRYEHQTQQRKQFFEITFNIKIE